MLYVSGLLWLTLNQPIGGAPDGHMTSCSQSYDNCLEDLIKKGSVKRGVRGAHRALAQLVQQLFRADSLRLTAPKISFILTI